MFLEYMLSLEHFRTFYKLSLIFNKDHKQLKEIEKILFFS